MRLKYKRENSKKKKKNPFCNTCLPSGLVKQHPLECPQAIYGHQPSPQLNHSLKLCTYQERNDAISEWIELKQASVIEFRKNLNIYP